MKIPQGFKKEGEARVWRLRKSLYGLRQASRNWYQKFTTALLKIKCKQSHADHSLFIYTLLTSLVSLYPTQDNLTWMLLTEFYDI